MSDSSVARRATVAVVACVALAAAVTWYVRSHTGYEIERLQPVAVMLDAHADPMVLHVGVEWADDGYCVGQLHPVVDEYADRIVVTTVENWLYRGKDSACAGVGTVDRVAWGSVDIAAPIGARTVYRVGSDQALTVLRR